MDHLFVMRCLVIVFLCLPFVSNAQSPETARLDSLTNFSRNYYNNSQPDSIYKMMSPVSTAQLPAAQFAAVMEGLQAQLGNWQSSEFRKIKEGTANYKVVFDKAVLDFFISQKDGKIQDFLFKPYEADVADKTDVISTNNSLKTSLDRKVDTIARAFMKKATTVGLAVAILRHNSVFSYGYGETVKGNGRVPDAATLFEIGSISKTFTATLLADAVQRGLVNADDPVNKYLPDSIPVLQKDGVPVTLKMLSNHSSGLPRLPTNLFTSADIANPYRHYDRKLLYSYLRTAVLERTPGSAYEYSNLATGLLGTILETVNKKTYEQLLKDVITLPLGMKHTVISLNETDKQRFAQGYNQQGNPVSSWDFGSLQGAGAIRSALSDMTLYLKAEMGTGPEKIIKIMNDTQQPTFKNKNNGVAMAWNGSATSSWLWHDGNTGGFSSCVAFNPSKKIAIIILSNNQDSIGELIVGFQRLLEE